MQLRISLSEIEPPIWRRVLVPPGLELGNLHHVIQVVMDWGNYHLHEFEVGERRLADPHPENPPGTEDEWRLSVAEALPEINAKLRYWYDFGDDWCHDVALERYRDRDEAGADFRVIDGARSAPPEDSGGPLGYMDKLDILRNPDKHDPIEARETLEWMGEGFDPDHFEVVAADQMLQRAFERYSD